MVNRSSNPGWMEQFALTLASICVAAAPARWAPLETPLS